MRSDQRDLSPRRALSPKITEQVIRCRHRGFIAFQCGLTVPTRTYTLSEGTRNWIQWRVPIDVAP